MRWPASPGRPFAAGRAGDRQELTAGEVKLNFGGAVHDLTDPVGRLLFNVLTMVAEFEAA